MTDATVKQQGEPKRRKEHPEMPQAADTSTRTPVAAMAVAVKAQLTLKWVWCTCAPICSRTSANMCNVDRGVWDKEQNTSDSAFGIHS